MLTSRPLHICLFVFVCFCVQPLYAQLGFDLQLNKPKPYDNRTVRAEKSGDKKFNAPRRFFQNTYTHYNYFFNASNKLNNIITRAKEAHTDDYANLLPFYNYSLENTKQQKTELDSVIYKSKTGIVLHDLRNDWIDDLYLLWGAAYYFQEEYDSAYQMFQFINYSFADKEKDGYYRYIGSHMDGSNTFTIATKENNSFPKRLITDPPSRNDAFIWQIRTMIQTGAMVEASSLIATLKNDPLFPERLQPSLHEVQALWFYQQGMWDSAAHHLTLALPVAETNDEKARWEYLAAQLFERSGKWEEAQNFYTKAIGHTNDPVMDIYARLNLIRINKSGGDDYIDKNIAELLKMAKREKYLEYRGIIYYMAAQMEMARNNFAAAQALLLKSAQFKDAMGNTSSEGFLELADLYYRQKQYIPAASFYDSVRVQNLPTDDAQRISQRQQILKSLVYQLNTVSRQDSVQRIAAMPEKDRDDYLRKLAKQLRREQGLKDEENIISAGNTLTSASDPFRTATKGEWYFYNDKTKLAGAVTFKQVWGNRPNVDNWRRATNVTAQLRNSLPNNTRGNPNVIGNVINGLPNYDDLLATIPISAAQMQTSNDSIANALFTSAGIYVNDIEDYESAIAAYEELRRRFGNYPQMDEALFHLYYAYAKTGNNGKADEIKKLLLAQYPTSRYTAIAATGQDPNSTAPTAAATKEYERIYDLYIQGSFAEAAAAKKIADSVYHTNYWSPQLLYIEAVYHIKQREDSVATGVLKTLIQQDAGTPMAAKAENLLNVLSRRAQIENELTNLQIERPVEEKTVVTEPVVNAPTPTPPSTRDTVSKAVVTLKKPDITRDSTNKLASAKLPGFVRNDTTTTSVVTHQPAPKIDSVAKTTLPPAAVVKTQAPDTTTKKPVPTKPASPYNFAANTPHYAVVVLNNVDNVFVNEAKNAFFRYSRENYYNQPIDVSIKPLDGPLKLLVIGNFANVQMATDYVQKAKSVSGTEIVPWLKGDKYSFTVISEANLQTLLNLKDLNAYQKFLEQNLPGKN